MYNNFNQVNIQLNRFNYYYDSEGGTLLHCAARYNLVGYTELLLKDGFDPNMRHTRWYRKTPVEFAKKENNFLILSFLEDAIKDDEKEKEFEISQEEQMDDRSLSLRYDSFTNSFMSCIYFLKCMGFNDIFEKNDKQLEIDHDLVTPWGNGNIEIVIGMILDVKWSI